MSEQLREQVKESEKLVDRANTKTAQRLGRETAESAGKIPYE